MPAPILHLGATVLCTHAGQAAPMAPFPRVMVSAQPVVTLTSPYAIAGCAGTKNEMELQAIIKSPMANEVGHKS